MTNFVNKTNKNAQAQDKLTPMMRQYYELKEQCADAVLFFRMGDFYEIFGEDAVRVAPLLDIVLTSREKGKDQGKIPFCGVPHHSCKPYVQKLLGMGYKIAIADQVEDPKEAKGIVKREIVKSLSPGINDDFESLDESKPNYFASVYEQPSTKEIYLLLGDLTTGELRVGNASDGSLVDILYKFRIQEILCREFYAPLLKNKIKTFIDEINPVFSFLPESAFRDRKVLKGVEEKFVDAAGNNSPKKRKISSGILEIASATLTYISDLGFDINQFKTISSLKDENCLALSHTILRDLEIFDSISRIDNRGTLFNSINRTQTPMGVRTLRSMLAYPLIQQRAIDLRKNIVESFYKLGSDNIHAWQQTLKGCFDTQRLATRLVNQSASPSDLLKMAQSIGQFKKLFALSKKFKLKSSLMQSFQGALKKISPLEELINSAILDENPILGSGNRAFKKGFNKKLDQYIDVLENGQTRLKDLEKDLKEKTGIASLKIKFHKNFGHLIEVTKSNASKVPKDFVLRQTMVNGLRYTLDSLQELSNDIEQADSNAAAYEQEVYEGLLIKIEGFGKDLFETSQIVAEIDVYSSHAALALEKNYCRASNSDFVHLKDSRHPVVEDALPSTEEFTPNDIVMAEGSKQHLITGPNMAGKSTLMRQLAVIAILNQMGAYIPAGEGSLPVFDNIYTRIGASDDIAHGHSTFMVEMLEVANILKNAGPKSLVILDEVGRGTSSEDGLAVAKGVFDDIVRRINCFCLFATHFHEMVGMIQEDSSVAAMQILVKTEDEKIIFTHRYTAGASGKSYGLEVAEMAGLPKWVIDNAAASLSVHRQAAFSADSIKISEEKIESQIQSELFAITSSYEKWYKQKEELWQFVKSIKPEDLTPREAINILFDLKKTTRRALPRARSLGTMSLFPEM